MPHRNAPLTETGRLRLARCVVQEQWPLRRAAERFQVSVTTAKRWADRYRQAGEAGLVDRSCRPRSSPARLPRRVERRILKLRVTRRWGPASIAGRLGMNPATVYRVLRRNGVPRLTALDRATGAPVRRYEHAYPGGLVHVDVKKLGRIPDGGGHRSVGRAQGIRNRARTRGAGRGRGRDPQLGFVYLHTAIDDHSRLAYTEVLADESAHTAVGFWQRAHQFFTSCGITVERVLSDNGSAYRSHQWRQSLSALGIKRKRTRPYRPQTNGKVERYHRTLLDEWAYAQPYHSELDRQATLTDWLHMYNHHRAHTALGGHPPASRVPNLTGQYI